MHNSYLFIVNICLMNTLLILPMLGHIISPVIINHRNQWVGFGDSAPQTSSFSIHSALGTKSALGSSMIYDQTSPISRTQIEITYGHHIILNTEKFNIIHGIKRNMEYVTIYISRRYDIFRNHRWQH